MLYIHPRLVYYIPLGYNRVTNLILIVEFAVGIKKPFQRWNQDLNLKVKLGKTKILIDKEERTMLPSVKCPCIICRKGVVGIL